MAKIVIIAPSDALDVNDAAKLLRNAGHDVDIEEPLPKSLLHIVLGLLGPSAYGFGPGYAFAPGPRADDDPDNDEEAEDPDAAADVVDEFADDIAVDEEPVDEFNFEGTVVDGEPIAAERADADNTVLIVEKLVLGPKTTYLINESAFSFWPADQSKPMQRVDVVHSNWHTSVEVEVRQGEKEQLLVGRDLLSLFAVKKPLSE